ncbi:MAG: preprotein translocase subunit SecG [Stomatobaculum sp.]
MLNTVLSIVFVVVCAVLSAIVLMQEGRDQGLGAIGGMADSYWGKIRGRSVEGTLEKLTRVLAVLFLLLAFVLNIVK